VRARGTGLEGRGTGLETQEEEAYLRAGHSPDLLRKLRRGHWRIQDETDLHGLTADEASRVLEDFIAEARGRGLRCVRVIHGKGTGVLKARARRELSLRDDVMAYVEAAPAQGGSGAVLVLLDA
jgi:DNA-nicking Smr family endonuclease